MADLVSLHLRAVEGFGSLLLAVAEEDWSRPTPCADWDVRGLVNHLLSENLWTPPLLAGMTIEQVGDRLEGDQLGQDPKHVWQQAAADSLVAVAQPDVLAATVHVSFGDISAEEYVTQLTVDHTIHAWDLARAIGGDEHLDPELVELALDYLSIHAEEWQGAGVFAPPVAAAESPGRQGELLALSGRQHSWSPPGAGAQG
ncbi:MAG TPA: TIGR03086 family metal-binding protein [Acidimicrobiales bacterium]|nr:TIGR03086 family metal-binding protein [Acidimicrobiales bacterium]